MKLFIALICIVLLASCKGDSKNSNLELSNFIKPEYLFQESLLSCQLVEGKTLNSVERFIPKFVDSFIKMGGETEELYFLFPLVEDQTDTKVFEVLLNHSDPLSLDRLNLTLAALGFNDIAKCESSSVSSRTLWLTDQTIFASPVIAEILECNYRGGYSYATIKLVLEQFTDALIKNNSQVNILYSEEDKSTSKFYWTNIFSSLESRQNFVESWQALEISKEIQGLLLEQSICESSQTYRRYKIL